jgi:glycoprotein endo-alpha-1,2-mannosidase
MGAWPITISPMNLRNGHRYGGLWVLLLGIALVSACSKPTPTPELPPVQDDQYLVGAHYYVWFPRNFRHGTLRGRLKPKQEPMLGLYTSDDVAVVEQHIAWCSQYGIDFLTLDWWPSTRERQALIPHAILEARNIGDIKFCIFYETWALGFDGMIGATKMDADTTARMVSDLTTIADGLFDHPSYLRVDGRPVIVLYLTRTLTGAFKEAIAEVRSVLAARGHDVFLVGDEVFWKVSPVVPLGRKPHPLVEDPQPSRVELFDAITAYNMYENERKSQKGYGAESTFMQDVGAKYAEYRAASSNSAYFVPHILPGYNDRGVRLNVDHYTIPRQWSQDAAEGTFFEEAFDRLGFPYMDKRLNMLLITSFNEWNEDTAIEPVRSAAPTSKDGSLSGTAYTEGYTYGGFGLTYLEVVREKVVAVCGRVTRKDGTPVSGQLLRVTQKSKSFSIQSDSRGYYRVSRLSVTPGPCEIRLPEKGRHRMVEVPASGCLTGINWVADET